MKCVVKNCENKDSQGKGRYFLEETKDDKLSEEYFICEPCWQAITTGEGPHSQISRNFKEDKKCSG